MRALAQEFTGRQTNRAGVDSEMRLLAQPIYRYENTKGDLIDGGLFVFVQGTDPEMFLLIEARTVADGHAPSGVSARPGCTASTCGSIATGKWSGMPPRSPGSEYRTGESRTRSFVSRPRRVGRDPRRVNHVWRGRPVAGRCGNLERVIQRRNFSRTIGTTPVQPSSADDRLVPSRHR